jgi:signal transduction histidine kinase
MPTTTSHAAPRLPEPILLTRRWAERRAVVLGAAALLYVGVFVLMRVLADPALAVSLVAVVPITLLALELGLRGGLAAAGVAVLGVLVNAVGGHPSLEAGAVATRALAFLAVGAVAGRFSDQLRAAHRRQARLLRSGLALTELRDAAGIPRLVAEAALDATGAAGATVTVRGLAAGETGGTGALRTIVPIVADDRHEGAICLDHEHPISAAELGAVRLLSVQAGLALGNLRRLKAERERAAAEAELQRVHDELIRSRAGIEKLLAEDETERARIAATLHEDLAQVLAAALMGVKVLRRATPDPQLESVDRLQEHVTAVLQDLRSLAGDIRPPALEQLGLGPALESLAARMGQERGRVVRVDYRDVPPDLQQAVSAGLFRIAQQVLAAVPGDVGISVGPAEVAFSLPAPPPASLADALAVRARTLGGRLDVDGTTVRVRVP